MERFFFILKFNHNFWFIVLPSYNLKRPLETIFFYNRVIEFPSNQSFSIVYSVGGVSSYLVFSCVAYQSFILSKAYIRGCCSVALIISNNFYFVIIEITYTRIGCSKVNSNCNSIYFVSHL